METVEQTGLFGDTTQTAATLDRKTLGDQLFNVLRSMSIEDVAKLMTNYVDEIVAYGDLCQHGHTCQKMSLLFNPHRLDTPTATTKYSFYTALRDASFCDGLARAIIFKKGAVRELFYQVTQLGINGAVVVNEFPPHVARDIYRKRGATQSSRVLDPCGGWGGRMIGASVVANNYECWEPATRTAAGLYRLSEFLRGFNNKFCAKIHNTPYEDADLPSRFYDIALTSPPYYDTEHYSDEPTNSFNRYRNFDNWSTGFYLPLIDKTVRALKPGRPFIINIGNRRYPMDVVLERHCKEKRYTAHRVKGALASPGGLRNAATGEVFYLIHNGKR